MVWVYISCIELLEAVKRSSPLNNMVSTNDSVGGSGFPFREKRTLIRMRCLFVGRGN